MTTYKFGDVIVVDFPQTDRTRKRRPALVILDIGDADILLAPITTKERKGKGDYKIRDWSECGLLRESWVRTAKISCLEKSDISMRLGQLSDYDKKAVIKIWKALYEFS